MNRLPKLVKEQGYGYDSEAIVVALPFIETIGCVANSVNTVFDGTYSAGRLYDHFDDYAYAQVMFITHSSVIALFIPKEEVEKDGEPVVEADGAERVQVSPKMKIGF